MASLLMKSAALIGVLNVISTEATSVYTRQKRQIIYENSAYEYLTALSDVTNGGLGARVTNTEQENAAQNYLENTLVELGYNVTLDDFSYLNNVDVEMNSTNLIIEIPGMSEQTIILCAHYDSTGADVGSQGAIDNGAGSSALLAIAQGLKDLPPIPYTVRMIWTGAEENGLNGAKDYVKKSIVDGTLSNVFSMINFDTVGGGDYLYVHSAHQDYSEYAKTCESMGLDNTTYSYAPYVRDTLLLASADAVGEIDKFIIHPDFEGYPSGETGDWSDHSPFACAGIPIAYVETTNFNINGEYGYDGYSQTINPAMWDCFNETTMGACNRTAETKWGMIWHTEFDRLDVLEVAFPGRVKQQLFNTIDSVINFIVDGKYLESVSAAMASNTTSPVSVYDAVAYEYLTALTDQANGGLGPRVTNTEQENAAQAYLESALTELGYNVTSDDFEYNITENGVDTLMNSTNLIIELPGVSEKTIVLVAHYDSTGAQKGSEGATDNGAGTSAVVTIAQALKNEVSIPYTVRMIWTGAEENGLNGAKDYVKKSLAAGTLANVFALVNFDTVGGGDNLYVHSAHQDYNEYAGTCESMGLDNTTYSYAPSVRDALVLASADAVGETDQFIIHPDFEGYPSGETGDWSDHSPFACAGIPVAYVETTNFNINGEYGYDGYSQTTNPAMWDCFNETTMGACNRTSESKWGKIWHTEYDRLDVLEAAFPGRVQQQLGHTVDSLITFLSTGVYLDTVIAGESEKPLASDKDRENEPENQPDDDKHGSTTAAVIVGVLAALIVAFAVYTTWFGSKSESVNSKATESSTNLGV
eukprot:CFRG6268T1